MFKTADGWIQAYKGKDALWIHDGNPKRPHALLTSGNHSNGFFNNRLVTADEAMLREAASDLLGLFVMQRGNISRVEGVVGPQTGATKLAEYIRDEARNSAGNTPFFASPAKSEFSGKKSMMFNDEELTLLPGKSILLCEDVLTTGSSVNLAAAASINAGGVVLPFVLVLVNRSGLKIVSGRTIVALIDRAMPVWEPNVCPLCKQGSEALRPKDNWTRLNALY